MSGHRAQPHSGPHLSCSSTLSDNVFLSPSNSGSAPPPDTWSGWSSSQPYSDAQTDDDGQLAHLANKKTSGISRGHQSDATQAPLHIRDQTNQYVNEHCVLPAGGLNDIPFQHFPNQDRGNYIPEMFTVGQAGHSAVVTGHIYPNNLPQLQERLHGNQIYEPVSTLNINCPIMMLRTERAADLVNPARDTSSGPPRPPRDSPDSGLGMIPGQNGQNPPAVGNGGKDKTKQTNANLPPNTQDTQCLLTNQSTPVLQGHPNAVIRDAEQFRAWLSSHTSEQPPANDIRDNAQKSAVVHITDRFPANDIAGQAQNHVSAHHAAINQHTAQCLGRTEGVLQGSTVVNTMTPSNGMQGSAFMQDRNQYMPTSGVNLNQQNGQTHVNVAVQNNAGYGQYSEVREPNSYNQIPMNGCQMTTYNKQFDCLPNGQFNEMGSACLQRSANNVPNNIMGENGGQCTIFVQGPPQMGGVNFADPAFVLPHGQVHTSPGPNYQHPNYQQQNLEVHATGHPSKGAIHMLANGHFTGAGLTYGHNSAGQSINSQVITNVHTQSQHVQQANGINCHFLPSSHAQNQHFPQTLFQHGPQTQPNHRQGYPSTGFPDHGQHTIPCPQPQRLRDRHGACIRRKEKDYIKSQLQHGRIVQVCGAPMAGKSTIVRQAVDEYVSESTLYGPQHQKVIQHHMNCKKVSGFDNLLVLMAKKFFPDLCSSDTLHLDEDTILSSIRTILEKCPTCHHILIFHKCENLRSERRDNDFLGFLSRMVLDYYSVNLGITIIFTTYCRFPTLGLDVDTVEIGLLTDVWDIITLFQHYLPHKEVLSYASICQRTLCLPEAVRLMAEEFLMDEKTRISAEELKEKINRDEVFLKRLFANRLDEVEKWVTMDGLLSLTHFSHAIENSFTEAHLEHVSTDDDNILQRNRYIKELKEKYIVRELPVIQRLVIHPLVVFYCMTSLNLRQEQQNQVALRGYFYDHSCNKYTNFLCRILMNAEANMRRQGQKSLVYGGLVQEWPNVKHLIEMALHCNINTYEAFVKVAVSAGGLITKCFTKEAQDFYQTLYNGAQVYGTPNERAVLQAFLGQAIAVGSGHDWQRANQHLTQAIQTLQQMGNPFFLAYAMDRKAVILHRQGRYQESLELFSQGRRVLRNVDPLALGENFAVSELQVEEEMITQEIQEAIPIIFLGKNNEARRRLQRLLERIKNTCENHPELSTLLNSLGLTEQRGNNDLNSALQWYKRSYNERMYMEKLCPDNLLVVLNNIGMILFDQGKLEESKKYLQRALDIRRQLGWKHYMTALTLTHISEINMKMGNYVESFKLATEAERILKETVKDHDMRLRIQLNLTHLRVVLRQVLHHSRFRHASVNRRDSIEPNRQSTRWYNMDGEGTHSGQEGNSPTEPQHLPCLDQLLSSGLNPVTHGGHFHWFQSEGDHAAQSNGNPTFRSRIYEHSPCGPSLQSALTDPNLVQEINTSIDAADLERSAEFYLLRLLHIAGEMEGTFSDDGHSFVLTAHEHLMLLHWGNSRERFEKHRNAILQYINGNPEVKQIVLTLNEATDSTYRFLTGHRDLYKYISETRYEDMDPEVFIRLFSPACKLCSFVPGIFTHEFWRREVKDGMQMREQKERDRRESDEMRMRINNNSNESGIHDWGRENQDGRRNDHNQEAVPQACDMGQISRAPNNIAMAQEVSFTSDTNNCELHDAGEDIPNFHELISSFGNSTTGFDRSSKVHYSNNLNDSGSPVLYLRQALQDEESLVSVEDNAASQFIESPRIIEEQRQIWEQIKNSCQNSSSSAKIIDTTTAATYHHSAYSGNTGDVSQAMKARPDEQVVGCGGNLAHNVRSSVAENNMACVSSESEKKGSSGTKLILEAISGRGREPVEQSWTGEEPPQWRINISLQTSDDNEEAEADNSIFNVQGERSVQGQLYLGSSDLFSEEKELDNRPGCETWDGSDNGRSTSTEESNKKLQLLMFEENTEDSRSSNESDIDNGKIQAQGPPSSNITKPPLVREETRKREISHTMSDCGSNPVYTLGSSHSDNNTHAPLKRASTAPDSYGHKKDGKEFSVQEYLLKAGFSRNMDSNNSLEKQKNKGQCESEERLEKSLALLTGRQRSENTYTSATNEEQCKDTEGHNITECSTDSVAASSGISMTPVAETECSLHQNHEAESSKGALVSAEPQMEEMAFVTRRSSDTLSSAVGSESGIGSSQRSTSSEEPEDAGFLLISNDTDASEMPIARSASSLCNGLFASHFPGQGAGYCSGHSRQTAESGFLSQSQSSYGGARPKVKSNQNQLFRGNCHEASASDQSNINRARAGDNGNQQIGFGEIPNQSYTPGFLKSYDNPSQNIDSHTGQPNTPLIHIDSNDSHAVDVSRENIVSLHSDDANGNNRFLGYDNQRVDVASLSPNTVADSRTYFDRSNSGGSQIPYYLSGENMDTVIPQFSQDDNRVSDVHMVGGTTMQRDLASEVSVSGDHTRRNGGVTRIPTEHAEGDELVVNKLNANYLRD